MGETKFTSPSYFKWPNKPWERECWTSIGSKMIRTSGRGAYEGWLLRRIRVALVCPHDKAHQVGHPQMCVFTAWHRKHISLWSSLAFLPGQPPFSNYIFRLSFPCHFLFPVAAVKYANPLLTPRNKRANNNLWVFKAQKKGGCRHLTLPSTAVFPHWLTLRAAWQLAGPSLLPLHSQRGLHS